MKSLWRCGSGLKPGKSFLAVTTKTTCHLGTWSSKIPSYMLRDEQRDCQCISRTCNAPIPCYHSWVVGTVLEKRNCPEQCFLVSDELCVLGLALALAGSWRVILWEHQCCDFRPCCMRECWHRMCSLGKAGFQGQVPRNPRSLSTLPSSRWGQPGSPVSEARLCVTRHGPPPLKGRWEMTKGDKYQKAVDMHSGLWERM